MFKVENFLLTFSQYLSLISPPLVGGDEGEGGPKGLYSVHPHVQRRRLRRVPSPSPIKRGRGIGGEISNIFG